jgi:hypothetical protein
MNKGTSNASSCEKRKKNERKGKKFGTKDQEPGCVMMGEDLASELNGSTTAPVE